MSTEAAYDFPHLTRPLISDRVRILADEGEMGREGVIKWFCKGGAKIKLDGNGFESYSYKRDQYELLNRTNETVQL